MNRRILHHTAVLLAICLISVSAASARAQTTESDTHNSNNAGHVVALGDTWTALAKQFDTSSLEILTRSRGINPRP